MKKYFLAFLFVFSLIGQDGNAKPSDDLEVVLALIRIPLVCAANTYTFNENKSTAQKGIIVAADVIRLYSQFLSIGNGQGVYDFNGLDSFWIWLDTVSLIAHTKDLFYKNNKKIKAEPEELKKLNKMLEELHETFLPFVEGIAAYFCAVIKDKRSGPIDSALRNICRSICSLSRVLDRLIVSENKTFEQYAWAVALSANIIYSYCIIHEYTKSVAETHESSSDESSSDESSSEKDEGPKPGWSGAGAGAYVSGGYGSGYRGFSWVDPEERERRNACQTLGISREEGMDRNTVCKAFRRAAKAAKDDSSRFKELSSAKAVLVTNSTGTINGSGGATGIK